MKKTKGYITIYALIIGLFIFSLIGFLVISTGSNDRVNNNQKDYLQACLIGESIANKILERDEFTKIYLSNNKKADGYRKFNIDMEEFPDLNNFRIDIVKRVAHEKYTLQYRVSYKNARVNSNLDLIKEEKNPDFNILIKNETEIDKIIEKYEQSKKYKILKEGYIFKIEEYYYYILDYPENLEIEEKYIIENGERLEEDYYIYDLRTLIIIGDEIDIKGIIVADDKTSIPKGSFQGLFINNSNYIFNDIKIEGGYIGRYEDIKNFEYSDKICENYYIDDMKIIKFVRDSFYIK